MKCYRKAVEYENEVDKEKERPGQYIDSESPFCRNCTRDDCPTNGDGCKAWEAYFIDNWNKNIMKSIGNHKKQRQFSGMSTLIW